MPRLDSGTPIDTSVLTQELAEPQLTGVRTVWHSSVASGLTPEDLGIILRAVDDRGDPIQYLTLAEEMEERDLHYRSVLSTRKLGVSGLDMVVEAVSDEDQAVEHAEFAREAIDIATQGELVDGLLDSLGKGFAAVEILWDQGAQWLPKEFKWRDPRFFMLDQTSGEELLLRTLENPSLGEPLSPFKFLVHRPRLKMGIPIRGGLARIAAIAFMCKGYSLKDWLAFAEVFGMPFRLGKYAPNATPEQKAALLRAVTNIGMDAAAIIPEDMMIEFIETSHATGGDKLFQGLADWLDRQISKCVLGQTASVEGTPGRLGADSAQDEVRQDIKEDDAKKLANTIRCDLIKPIIDLNFGELPKVNMYPRVKFVPKEKEDLKLLSEALPPFIDRGAPVEVKTILDKFNLPMPDLTDPEVMLLGSAVPVSPVREDPDSGESPPTPPDDVENPDADNADELELLRTRTFLKLLARYEAGGELSETDKQVLAICATERDDEVDRLAKERLKMWARIMNPIIDPILAAAQAAESFAEVEAALGTLPATIDVTEFVRTLATETFKTRALGDATDKIKF